MIRAVCLAMCTVLASCAPSPGAAAAPVCAIGAGRAAAPKTFPRREERFAADIAADQRALAGTKLATIGLGDSIMQRWPDAVLGQMFGAPALSAGIGGYNVAQVLAQLDRTDWHGQRPKTVVLMIGTNDLARNATACDVVAGIEAIRARVAKIFPGARFTVVSVLPRGARLEEFAPAIAQVNATLAARSKTQGFTFVDANTIFARSCAGAKTSGQCTYLKGPKNVHPTPEGYRMLAQSLGR